MAFFMSHCKRSIGVCSLQHSREKSWIYYVIFAALPASVEYDAGSLVSTFLPFLLNPVVFYFYVHRLFDPLP